MEIAVGFILGILASVIASFFSSWLTESRQRPLLLWLRHPLRDWRIRHQIPEREIAACIRRLYAAWTAKDLVAYLSCWAEDCVRIQGTDSNVSEGKQEIKTKFISSSAKYAEITVPVLVVEDIRVAPDKNTATANVYYRFELTRAGDSLPTIEHSHEVYSFRKIANDWKIAANIDHFSEITAAPATTSL